MYKKGSKPIIVLIAKLPGYKNTVQEIKKYITKNRLIF